MSACLGTEKLSSFQLGLHHFNPPPKEISYKRDNEVLHQRGKSLGVEQCVQIQKKKGMQTQYEVNNFSRVTLLSQVEFFVFSFHRLDMAHLNPSNGTKGPSRNVSSIWKVKDHGSRDVTWKPDTIF
jgi:hypothetical protein